MTGANTHECKYATAADGTSCDDDNASTTVDKCTNGVCAGIDPCTASISTCNDGTTTCTDCMVCKSSQIKGDRGWDIQCVTILFVMKQTRSIVIQLILAASGVGQIPRAARRSRARTRGPGGA